ncbi:MAB_1171c family putative transporter [Amycolatopsis sp. NPDC049252]|uniref:MAB_1171c family putative transporter n=1 Tax=Amycolatopsis sp. NPDC049252 TaxID=3363933 RepID=UPI00371A552D
MAELLRRYGPALLAWVVVLCLRPGPAPGRRLVRLCVLGLAVSQTALTPGFDALVHVFGFSDLERLIGHLGMLVAVWAGAETMLRLHGFDAQARWQTAWSIFSGVAMCVVFAATPNLLPQSPWVLEYCVVYAFAVLPGYLIVSGVCLRVARATPDRVLRTGLGLVVAGAVAAALYMVSRTLVAFDTSDRTSVTFAFGRGFLLSKALPTGAHVLVLTGVALPAFASWLRRRRQYRRLAPLWLALYRAEPAIALEPPGLLGSLFPSRLRGYRQVIEIRDGLLALRPHRPDAPPELNGPQAEAAIIAAALHARATGSPPLSSPAPLPGGHDLASDVEFLCLLADAFREHRTTSPAVP